jgi:calcineurin-like phosphoesterase family protein
MFISVKTFDYIIADTHFNHTNMLSYELSRIEQTKLSGYNSFEAMIIDNWNKTINTNTNVLHLGDVAFGDGYKLVEKLNGNITLIIGNHDKKEHIIFYKQQKWKIIDKIVLDIPKAHLVQNQLSKQFSKEQLSNNLLACLVMDIDNKRIMFSHFPVFDNNPYDKKYKKITEVLELIFEITNCDINIHGHTHSKKANKDFCINACLELNNFKPLELISIFNN